MGDDICDFHIKNKNDCHCTMKVMTKSQFSPISLCMDNGYHGNHIAVVIALFEPKIC